MPLAQRPANAGAEPRRIAGVAREGVQIPLAALQERCPALSLAAVQGVRRLLGATVVQTLSWRDAGDWGLGVQQRYGELVERSLALARQPALQAAQAELQRLHGLLAEVANAIGQPRPGGLLGRFRSNPWQLLRQHQTEIDQLRASLVQAVPGLMSLAQAQRQVQREQRALAAEVEIHGVAAAVLADVLANRPAFGAAAAATFDAEPAALAHVLLGRASELTRMHAHVSADDPLRQAAGVQVDALVDAVRQAVLLLLPAWLEKAVHAREAGLTPTLARRLAQELESLLQVAGRA